MIGQLFSSVSDISEAALPLHSGDNGSLSVLEKANFPFAIARLFFVSSTDKTIRGQHAHKRCSQYMVCLQGVIEMVCDDGVFKRTIILDRMDKAALIPPAIWATQIYRVPNSVLLVACDRVYEEADYIRDYDQFLHYRGINF